MLRKVTKIIGLTGPVGAGKDEVAKILRKKRALIIDADKVAHTLYKGNKNLQKKIVKAFGTVNRKKLGEIVFGDKKKLRQLNQIVHPYLNKKIRQEARGLRPKAKGIIVINAAVLKEIGLVNYVDEVWVVMASRKKRFSRLVKSGLTKAQANARLKSQMSQKDYLKLADVVVENDGSLKQLSTKVLDLIK